MGNGGVSCAMATWHLLVDGVNAHTWWILGFPTGFSILLGFLVFKTSSDIFSTFTKTYLLYLRKLSSHPLWFFVGRGLSRWFVCSGAPQSFSFKVHFSPLFSFSFYFHADEAMVSSILISSFSPFLLFFFFFFLGLLGIQFVLPWLAVLKLGQSALQSLSFSCV